MIEYDRTTRVDKNYEKFRRYDSFLTWWWRHTHYYEHDAPPFVLFVCQNETHLDKFLAAADRALTGQLWHPSVKTTEEHYPGRRRILFACEADAHAGELHAHRVPAYPPGHPSRQDSHAEFRRALLPGPRRAEDLEPDDEPGDDTQIPGQLSLEEPA